MNDIASQTLTISAVGGNGAAVGSGTTIPIRGFLLDVFLNYDPTAPATTDVTISEAIFGNILVVSNSVTDAWHAPRKATCDATGAATGLSDLVPVNGPLTIAIAGCDELVSALEVTVRWMTV